VYGSIIILFAGYLFLIARRRRAEKRA